MATESAYDRLREIDDFYTAKINSLIEADAEDEIPALTARYEDEIREALHRAA